MDNRGTFVPAHRRTEPLMHIVRHPQGPWSAKGAKTETMFEELDLSEEFFDCELFLEYFLILFWDI